MAGPVTVEPLKNGDLAWVVRHDARGDVPVKLAEFYDLNEEYPDPDPDEIPCQWWSYFGTDFTDRAEDVTVVERVTIQKPAR